MRSIKYPDGKASEIKCHDGIYTRGKDWKKRARAYALPNSRCYLIIDDAPMDKLLKQGNCNYESNAKHQSY